VGKGVQVISLSIEKDLLKRSDQAARKLGVSRAWLVSQGLRAMLGKLARAVCVSL
jgi:metal-responsive CopG/Arc/MetJ family transcriptional regulator